MKNQSPIVMLLEKIEKLENDLKQEKKNNYNCLMSGFLCYKGIPINELYNFYEENKKGAK